MLRWIPRILLAADWFPPAAAKCPLDESSLHELNRFFEEEALLHQVRDEHFELFFHRGSAVILPGVLHLIVALMKLVFEFKGRELGNDSGYADDVGSEPGVDDGGGRSGCGGTRGEGDEDHDQRDGHDQATGDAEGGAESAIDEAQADRTQEAGDDGAEERADDDHAEKTTHEAQEVGDIDGAHVRMEPTAGDAIEPEAEDEADTGRRQPDDLTREALARGAEDGQRRITAIAASSQSKFIAISR